MPSLPRPLVCAALLASVVAAAATAAAAELPVSPAQAESMGLESRAVTAAQWIRVTRLPARVELDPRVRRVITARFAGTVSAVLVREGDEVKAGAPLLGVQSPAWAEAVALAQANSARLTQAAQAEGRARALLDAGVIARRELEAAQSELAALRAAAASDAARSAGARVGPDGTVELPAPAAGRVLRRPHDPGDAVAEGEVLLEIASGDGLVALGSAPARLAGRIAPGMRASTAAGLTGEVTAVSAALDPHTQALAVRFALPAGAAPPGQMIELAIARPAPPGTVELPSAAVVDVAGKPSVFVAHERGFAVQPVELLARDGASAWVSGLPDGERVVSRGVLALKSLAEGGDAGGE